jgi:hypothetical protein
MLSSGVMREADEGVKWAASFLRREGAPDILNWVSNMGS